LRPSQEILAAIRHLQMAYEGAMRACAPPQTGVVIETADQQAARHLELLKDENYQRAIILARMIDALRWTLKQPTELAEWIVKFEKMDRVEKLGFAARLL